MENDLIIVAMATLKVLGFFWPAFYATFMVCAFDRLVMVKN